jgi:PAS domain S-box-containing protein
MQKKILELEGEIGRRDYFYSFFEEYPHEVFLIEGNRYIDCNKAALKKLGLSGKEELQGLHPAQLAPDVQPDGRNSGEKAEELLAEARRNGYACFEWDFRCFTGKEFSAEIVLAAIDRSERSLLFAVCRDITERKAASAGYNKSDQRFRDTLENVDLAACMLDTEGRITFCNDFLLRMTGWKRNEVLNQSWHDLFIPEASRLSLKSSFKKALANPHTPLSWHYESDLMTRRGERRSLSWDTTLLHDSAGNVTGVASLGRNLTERGVTEVQLRQSQRMEAMGTLSGGIAHDFNNILWSILGYTDMALQKIPEGQPVRRYLENVYQAGERAQDLIKQILSFSRRSEHKPRPLHLIPLIKEVLKLLRAAFPATVEIVQDIRVESDLILADVAQIHQMLVNLCNNAADAMHEKGGILTIVLQQPDSQVLETLYPKGLQPGSYLEIIVRDTGVGMSEELLPRIFDPLFSSRQSGERTGLGLSVVHGIVKSCGGKVSVESREREGSTFHVYLPTHQESKHETDNIYIPAVFGGTERILFIDDEPLLAELGGTILSRFGYQTSIQTSSVEALRLVTEKPETFDLVVTDLTMPNMTGIELAKQLKRIRTDLPVVVCTGFNDSIAQEEAKALGIHKVLYKPVIPAQLAQTVRQVLDDSKNAQGLSKFE